MADARSSGKRDQQAPQGKEKFRNKQRRDNNFNSNKRKQEGGRPSPQAAA